mmetsp:Transcript_3093/g.8758  ORF Transcript_3093/g.8758 Transcript_3093/m.8758 type:complete len:320 (+) Transcript_3093:23-982(+)
MVLFHDCLKPGAEAGRRKPPRRDDLRHAEAPRELGVGALVPHEGHGDDGFAREGHLHKAAPAAVHDRGPDVGQEENLGLGEPAAHEEVPRAAGQVLLLGVFQRPGDCDAGQLADCFVHTFDLLGAQGDHAAEAHVDDAPPLLAHLGEPPVQLGTGSLHQRSCRTGSSWSCKHDVGRHRANRLQAPNGVDEAQVRVQGRQPPPGQRREARSPRQRDAGQAWQRQRAEKQHAQARRRGPDKVQQPSVGEVDGHRDAGRITSLHRAAGHEVREDRIRPYLVEERAQALEHPRVVVQVQVEHIVMLQSVQVAALLIGGLDVAG